MDVPVTYFRIQKKTQITETKNELVEQSEKLFSPFLEVLSNSLKTKLWKMVLAKVYEVFGKNIHPPVYMLHYDLL